MDFVIAPELQRSVPGANQYKKADRGGCLLEVINPTGEDAVKVHQDARVYVSSLAAGQEVEHPLRHARGAYAYLIEGKRRSTTSPFGRETLLSLKGKIDSESLQPSHPS